MENLFLLVGKSLKVFQQLEKNIKLFVYCTNKINDNNLYSVNEVYEDYLRIESKSLGVAINELYSLGAINSKEDKEVLDFIKNERNYIAHKVFNDNTTTENKENRINYIINYVEIINRALEKMIKNIWIQNN